MNRLIRRLLASAVFFSLALPPAFAQLEEIIVTAQKREESLQDVPIAMQAFTGEMINNLGVNRVVDIVNHAPNINLSGQNHANRAIAIRGIGTSDFFAAAPGSVGIYIDDVTMSSPYLTNLGIYDMERVEILRGPQNALFGRNTTAGAINFLSKMPAVGDERDGFFRLTYGNYNRIDIEAASNIALGDTAAARISVKSYDRDGIWNNMTNGGGEYGEKDQKAARATFLFEPSDRLAITANVHYGDEDSQVDPQRVIGSLSSPTGLLDVNPASGTFLSGQQLVWEGVDYATYNSQGVDASFPQWENIGQSGADTHEIELFGAWVKFDLDFDWGSLTSITAYEDSETRFVTDSGGQGNTNPTPVSIAAGLNQPEENINIDQDQAFEQLSQEFRIQSNQDQRMRWIAGLYFFEEDSVLAQNIRFGVAIPVAAPPLNLVTGGLLPPTCSEIGQIPIGDPAMSGGSLGLWNVSQHFTCGYPGAGYGDIMSFSIATMENSVWSPYAQFEYDINSDLTFTFGLRYTDDTKEIPSYYVGFMDITGFATDTFFTEELLRSTAAAQLGDGTAAPVCTGGMFCAEDTTRSDLTAEEWGGKIGLDWHVTPNTMLWGSYSRGFRSGRYDVEFLHGPQTGFPLADSSPETLDAFEIGAKMTLADNTVNFNISVFFYEWKNKQAFFVDPLTGPAFGNIPKSESQGAEFELIWSPTPTLLISAGLGLLDTEITEASPLPLDEQGHELQQAPETSYNFLINKDFEFGNGTLSFQVDYAYRDDSSNGLAFADLADRLDEAELLGARATYAFGAEENFEVSVFGENLLESRYCTYMFGLTFINGSTTCVANEGQTMYGIQGNFRF